jgi:hypothetical protein
VVENWNYFMVAVVVWMHIATAQVSTAESPIAASSRPCAYQEFDFRAGDWNVFDAAGPMGLGWPHRRYLRP